MAEFHTPPVLERFRGRDALSVSGLLSLSRGPLAIAFPFVQHRPVLALGVLAAAAASDMLDGHAARKLHQVTATGAALDPLMDKIFVITVALTLLLGGRIPLWVALLLGARDLVEMPLALWFLFGPRRSTEQAPAPMANPLGKGSTVLQFLTVAAALFGSPHRNWLALATGLSGAVAGASYWVRTARIVHAARTGVT